MAEPRIFTPKTQQSLERTLEATRKAMAEVRENMSILDEAKERAEQRIESLTEELARAKQPLADSIASEKTLRKELEQHGAEQKRADARFAAAQGELESLRKQLQDAAAERAALAGQAQEVLAAERARAEKLNTQLVSEGELREALSVDLDVARRAVDELKHALAAVQETLP